MGLLPEQKIACSMLHQPTLLLGRIWMHKSPALNSSALGMCEAMR
jgi:hypothetical protein